MQPSANMRRDISNFMFDNLAFFQSFDDVKVYYDDGQDVVSRAHGTPLALCYPKA